MELYPHQKQTIEFLRHTPRAFDLSDCGTGKTRAVLAEYVERRRAGGGKALVFAPKSILEPTWVAEIRQCCPGIRYSIAHASNRQRAFRRDADIYLVNVDGARWCLRHLPLTYWHDFDTLVLDESSAVKNPATKRSRAIGMLASHFPYRRLMSGTPTPNSISEIWNQVFLLDDGQRLGRSYWQFRDSVCYPVGTGTRQTHTRWLDKPGAQHQVFEQISDISIRHRLEACLSIPPNHAYRVAFELPQRLRRRYQQLLHSSLLDLGQSGGLTPIRAAALCTKLLQIASGAVYTGEDNRYEVIDESRTELVMDLLRERPHSIVVFLWAHQRDRLIRQARRRGYTFSVLDGTVSTKDRTAAVHAFQNGDLNALFVHPQTAAHGLNLTRGTTTIWASPTYSSEAYHQLHHRIYRAGQTRRTQTLHVVGRNTIEEVVYQRLGAKLDAMALLLKLMAEYDQAA